RRSSGLARAVAGELRARRFDRGVLAAVAGLQPLEVRLERVARVEQQAHRGRVRLAAALAQRVEERLHLVRGLGELREAEGAAAALDRVRGAEDGIEQLRVLAAGAERHRL